MSGKFNNRTLFLVLLIFAAILIISRVITNKKQDRTLHTNLVQIDTSMVSSILLYPEKENGELLEFKKTGNSWSVTGEEITASASPTAVKNMLGEFQNLKVEQLVALSSERWSEYQVEDSTGTRVVIKEGNRPTLDLIVGRFQYQPPARNTYSPYGQNRMTGKTYVRLSGEEEVYAVNGFLSLSLNQGFSQWRNQTITSMNTSQVSRIIFNYPADSGFVAERSEAGWMVSGLPADSSSMVNYLRKASQKSHAGFADGFQAMAEADFKLTFEGDHMKPQQVKASIQEDGSIILGSSFNPGTWFLFDSMDKVGDLFPSSDKLRVRAPS